MNFILTEEDRKEVMKNYFGEFNQKFYDFLKANITVHSQKMENFSKPFVLIYIDGKSRILNSSKKSLVNKILNTYSEDFPKVPEASLRLTTKKLIDDLKKEYYE